MYSSAVTQLLDTHEIETGDRIHVTVSGDEHTGRLIPRSNQGNADCLVIKLDSGYNLSIDVDGIDDIERLEDGPDTGTDSAGTPEHDPELPDILVLHTGGTIASRVSYEEGGVIPAFEPEDLLEMYPELFEAANIDSDVVAQMLSEDMEPGHWQEIAQAVADVHDEYDGIIIGHGTDTIQYTAAALSFMLEGLDIPIVIVGAQRSSDRPSSDAATNLMSAAAFIEEGCPGVYACLHADSSDTECAVHRGTRVRKMHTSRRDAFQSIGVHPVATVDIEDYSVEVREDIQGPETDFELRDDLDPDVGLVKTTPGMQPEKLELYEDHAGIVLEGTGLGHIPISSFDEHTAHHEETEAVLDRLASDAVVVMTSQCINGSVNMNVYDAGVKIQEAGVISGGSMLPGTAYVKLMWALAQDEDTTELMTTDIAGELTDREEYDTYR